MQTIHLTAELARRGRAKKLANLAQVERPDGLALLLAAITGEVSRNSIVRSPVAELGRALSERGNRGVRQQSRPREAVPNERTGLPEAASGERRVSPFKATIAKALRHESQSAPRGSRPSDTTQAFMPDLDLVQAGFHERFDDALGEEENSQEIPAVDVRDVEPELARHKSDDETPLESPPASYEPANEQPVAVERDTAPQDNLRGEILAEVQDLLRGRAARDSEERASQSIASSRARLASYR